jgi:hypothetical protein
MAKRKSSIVENYNTFQEPLCNTCVHYNGDATCKAFPEGIPLSIIGGEDHRIPIKEQTNDIVYKSK